MCNNIHTIFNNNIIAKKVLEYNKNNWLINKFTNNINQNVIIILLINVIYVNMKLSVMMISC